MPIAAIRNWVAGSDILRRVAGPIRDRFFYDGQPECEQDASQLPRRRHEPSDRRDVRRRTGPRTDFRGHRRSAVADNRPLLVEQGNRGPRREIRHFFRKHQAVFPRHDVTFLCNTPGEHRLLQRLGLPAVYCNQKLSAGRIPIPHCPRRREGIRRRLQRQAGGGQAALLTEGSLPNRPDRGVDSGRPGREARLPRIRQAHAARRRRVELPG